MHYASSILFFKTFNASDIFYRRTIGVVNEEKNATVSFRCLQLNKDIPLIHRWVNHPHAERFWQLKGYTPDMLFDLCNNLLLKPHYHSLIGLYNDTPVCQADVYLIHGSELASFIPSYSARDCGIHFLTAPPRESFKGLSLLMLRAFMDTYFSYPYAGDLYAEPDELNALANRLAVKAGFQLYKKASLPDKTANIYKITKEQFLSQVSLINAT